MSETPIEPGLLKVFRGYAGLRLALLTLALCSETRTVPRVQRYPLLGLLESGLLLILLTWPWTRKVLDRAYLPLALAVASAGPIFEHALTVALRVLHGASRVQSGTDAWLLIADLFVPLVLASWQYGFGSVVVFCLGTSMLELGLAVPLAIMGGPRWLTVFGLAFVQVVLYLIVGYLVAWMVRVQRAQREELALANTQLKQYATTVERLTVSHERNRLARELHDTLAHSLSALTIQLEAVRSLWASHPEKARGLLDQADETARTGLTEARRSLQALRALPLQEMGLAAAVRELAESTAQKSDAALSLSVPDVLGADLPQDVEQGIYRIAQEALENIARHAGASEIKVLMEENEDHVGLVIEDNGQGVDPETMRTATAAQAEGQDQFGIRGMREAAALMRGTLQIDSTPGQGTRVALSVPAR